MLPPCVWHIMALGFKCVFLSIFLRWIPLPWVFVEILKYWSNFQSFPGSSCGDFSNDLHLFGGFPQKRLENVHFRPVAEVDFA